MSAIYEPKGAAGEYSALACNLYRGCGHGCRYCYAPACLRMAAAEFGQPAPRPGILGALRQDAFAFRGDPREVLLCFTCDPYQPIEQEWKLTRQALGIFAANQIRPRVLTKNPLAAMLRDTDVLGAAKATIGTTLAWTSADDCRAWETHAPSPAQRIEGLRLARQAGLRTWLSIEPVIDPLQALDVLLAVGREVDEVKIGKMNHNPEVERAVDWTAFCRKAVAIARAGPAAWYIKNDLWKFADIKTRAFGQRSAP